MFDKRGIRMNHRKSIWRINLVALAAAGVSLPARAQDESPPAAPTRAEFTRLQGEVREQRQLIIQMLQTEQQRYDMLLRLMQAQAGGPLPGLPAPAAAEPSASESAGPSATSPRRSRASEAEHRLGSVEGTVTLPGGDTGDVYIYVENIKAPPARGKTIEIRQEGKQFLPRVAVVQAGTSVVFPNLDTVFHNVFSNSPRNSFDLGSYRAGDKPRAVTLTAPGVVDVFCNMHQKMSASILVVPSAIYTKVRPDGSFRLENVPVGPRRIVAWGPRAKAAQQRVEVTAGGSQTSFVLEHEDRTAHTNKLGQAYGSYRD
jgi:plastocyanin